MGDYLSQVTFFRRLSPKGRKQIADVCERRRFQKGVGIFEEGEPADSVWLIRRGWVHLLKRTPTGGRVTIFTVTPEEVLCGFSAVVGSETYYASAVSATDVDMLRVPCKIFADLLRSEPGFAQCVLAIYHTRMRHLAEAISMAQAPVEKRLAHILLRLRAAFGKTVPITHHELSRMAGTRWETSIRTLSAMKRRGWLACARGKITVVKPGKLQALVSSHGSVKRRV